MSAHADEGNVLAAVRLLYPLEEPPPDVADAHLARMMAALDTAAPPVTTNILGFRRAAVAAAIVGATVAGSMGLAAAGVLPDPLQNEIATIVRPIGLHLPSPADEAPPSSGGAPSDPPVSAPPPVAVPPSTTGPRTSTPADARPEHPVDPPAADPAPRSASDDAPGSPETPEGQKTPPGSAARPTDAPDKAPQTTRPEPPTTKPHPTTPAKGPKADS